MVFTVVEHHVRTFETSGLLSMISYHQLKLEPSLFSKANTLPLPQNRAVQSPSVALNRVVRGIQLFFKVFKVYDGQFLYLV